MVINQGPEFQFRDFLSITYFYEPYHISSKHPQQVKAKNIEKSAPSKPSKVFSM